jgi:hypothetical protein
VFVPLAEVARRATFLGEDDVEDACGRLQSLGLGLRASADVPTQPPTPQP